MSTSMKFQGYSSIENAVPKNVRYWEKMFQDRDLPSCCVTEKIHGANSSLLVTKDESTGELQVGIARRGGLLAVGDYKNFMRSDQILDRYQEAAKKLFQTVQAIRRPQLQQLTIYGELYGGLYHHPDVPKDPEAKQIQGKMSYSPHVEFAAFDIMSISSTLGGSGDGGGSDGAECGSGSSGDGAVETVFEHYEEVVSWCQEAKMPVVPIDFQGTFHECLEFSRQTRDSPSSVPRVFHPHFPPPVLHGRREGNVIKAVEAFSQAGGDRLILKDKSEFFCEVHGDGKANINMSNYFTEGRLMSVVSKMMLSERAAVKKVVSAFMDDALVDYKKDHPDLESAPLETKKLQVVYSKAFAFVKKHPHLWQCEILNPTALTTTPPNE